MWYKLAGLKGKDLGQLSIQDGKIVGRDLDPKVSKALKDLEEQQQGRVKKWQAHYGEDGSIFDGFTLVGLEDPRYLFMLQDELRTRVRGFVWLGRGQLQEQVGGGSA